MIENKTNFISVCINTLERLAAAETDAQRRAILSRQTENGLKFAVDFCRSLDHEEMTERELNHAIRLTYFRGNICPVF